MIYEIKYRKLFLFILFTLMNTQAQAQEVATACGHHDYAPWHWERNCPEITETLFKKLGVAVDFTYIGPWKRCQKNIEMGNVDIAPCLFKNPSRQQYSRFTETPMFYGKQVVFVKKGKEFSFSTWADLKGKTAVKFIGSSFGKEFDRFLADNVNVTNVSSNQQMFRMVEYDRGDFVPHGFRSGAAILKALALEKNFSVLTPPIFEAPLYFVVSKESKYTHLIPQLETLLQEPEYKPWVETLVKKHTDIYVEDYLKNIDEQ